MEQIHKDIDTVPIGRNVSHMEQTPSYQNRVASEVRASIARAGVTATQVAVATGISKASLSRKLSGASPFNSLELGLLGSHLGVEPASFLPPLDLAAAQAVAS